MLRYLAFPLCFLMSAAAGADLPVPPRGVTPEQMRAAIKRQDARKLVLQKKFEDLLSAPIGHGRLE